MTTTMTMTKLMKNKLHIYAPSFEHGVVALARGVSVVSVNGPLLGHCPKGSTLTWEQIAELVETAKHNKQQIHLRLNTVIHNADIEHVARMLEQAENIGVNAITFSDTAILQQVKRMGHKLALTLATETTVTNNQMISFWYNQGVDTFQLTRELNVDQIRQIIELRQQEAFQDIKFMLQIHGPVGIFHTLRPVIKNYSDYLQLNAKDSIILGENLAFVEELRKDEYYRVIEDDRGTYIFSAYDISLYEYLPELIKMQIDYLKIDIFSTQSVATMEQIIAYYQEAIDQIINNQFIVKDNWQEQLQIINQFPIHNQFIETGAPK